MLKGEKVRKLLEVRHIETSLLTRTPAHPEAGIVLLNKSVDGLSEDEIADLLTWDDEHITPLAKLCAEHRSVLPQGYGFR